MRHVPLPFIWCAVFGESAVLRRGGDPQLGPPAHGRCCRPCPLLPGLLRQVPSQPRVGAGMGAGAPADQLCWTGSPTQFAPVPLCLGPTVSAASSSSAACRDHAAGQVSPHPLLCNPPCPSSAHHPAASLLPRPEPSRDRHLRLSCLSQAPCSDWCHHHLPPSTSSKTVPSLQRR